ncbi:PAS domain-containing protein [Neorhizobium sp. T786]|uniref:PAS domain-containing protein n=1 Tax=Pseudorhizobium xiangyangii TaxID=2883104 RepID=UPI001CFF6FDE|nr:PAS domain-containing protein [Neorhizobium xiangyangii]MCB5205253.1 PAS domain-containing protein [Neorhizobium xiangyangii]
MFDGGHKLTEVGDLEDEAGIFTWCLDTGKLYGDSTVASIFGLDPHRTEVGLPASAYADRIYAEDRGAVAALVSKAIRDGRPYRAEYRVVDPAGFPRWVLAFGRCFRDPTGNPKYYSGIIYPADELLDDL